MVARNEIYWANLDAPAGRRPICVLTRDAAIAVLNSVTIAPLTRTIRGISTEVRLGPDDGLPEDCVVNCDSVESIKTWRLDPQPIAMLSPPKRVELDRALRYALDIVY